MRKLVRFLLPSLALVLLTPLAHSAEKKYRFEFFGGAGYPIRETFVIGPPQSPVPVDAKRIFSLGGMGGVRFGIDGRRYWGQDYAYSYGQNATRFETELRKFSFTNRVHQASTSILFYPWSLERRAVFPYATAGVGATWVSLSQRTVSASANPVFNSFGPLKSELVAAFHAGLGVRFRMSDRISLRLDARDYMSRALRYGLPQSSPDRNEPVLPLSGVFHQICVTFGFIIHF